MTDDPPLSSRRTRAAIQVLVLLAGMAALSWEVLWQLEASLALGVSSLGTAITLATTMAGMTLGSLLAGRLLRGRALRRPLRVYAALELAIGVAGLALLPGFRLLEGLDAWVYGVSPALAPLLRCVGIALLLGVPTLAMGASVPVFARIARSYGASVSVLYGTNTLGAAGGVLLIAFVLIRALGVEHTIWVVALLNLGVGAGALLAPAGAPVSAEREAYEASGAPWPPLPRWIGPVVFATGFATFGLEVAWFRSLRAAFQSVTESFAVMLVAVLVPLGLGARLVPRIRRAGVSPGALLAGAGVAVLAMTPLVERIDLLVPVSEHYGWMLLRWMGLCLAVLGVPMFLLGLLLPWFLDELRDPLRCAKAYALNTLGAVAGSLGAAWLLLPAIGFARSAWLLGAALVLLALPLLRSAGRLRAVVAGAAALALAAGFGSSLGRERVQGPGYTLLERPSVLAYDEGPDATVSVVSSERGERLLLIDGFTASAEGTQGSAYLEFMGWLPMLAHPDPQRALVICFGTGRTANAVREMNPGRLDVIELSPAVLRMAEHFPANRQVLEDPRVHARQMDGRAWLRRSEERYDVVTLEPMPPAFAGVNALYSQEFYEIVASRLAPGGVVAQWLPFHLVPPFHAASIANTFQRVFPDAILWVGPKSGTGILLGRRKSQSLPLGSEWPGLARASEARRHSAQRLSSFVVLDPQTLLAYGDLGVPITDDNQLLAYHLVRRDLLAFGPQVDQINLHLVREMARGGRARLPEPPAPVPGPAEAQ